MTEVKVNITIPIERTNVHLCWEDASRSLCLAPPRLDFAASETPISVAKICHPGIHVILWRQTRICGAQSRLVIRCPLSRYPLHFFHHLFGGYKEKLGAYLQNVYFHIKKIKTILTDLEL